MLPREGTRRFCGWFYGCPRELYELTPDPKTHRITPWPRFSFDNPLPFHVFVPTFPWKPFPSSRKETKIESGYRSPRLLWTRTNKESTGSNVPTTRRHQNLNDFHSVQSHPTRRPPLLFALIFPPILGENCFMILWWFSRRIFIYKNRIFGYRLDLFIGKNDYFFFKLIRAICSRLWRKINYG